MNLRMKKSAAAERARQLSWSLSVGAVLVSAGITGLVGLAGLATFFIFEPDRGDAGGEHVPSIEHVISVSPTESHGLPSNVVLAVSEASSDLRQARPSSSSLFSREFAGPSATQANSALVLALR